MECRAPREAFSEAGWTVWVECEPLAPFRPLRGASPLLFGRPLDLNQASPEVLEVLPGIGPARARAIASERELRPFGSLAELTRVKGIGQAIATGLVGWAEARPKAGLERSNEPQKPLQLLPNPSENSYKERARPASCDRLRKTCTGCSGSPVGGRVRGLASQ